MEDPSILDYLKSRLRFQVVNGFKATVPAPTDTSPTGSGGIPWRSLLALGFGLLAQYLIEPPGRNWEISLVVYLMAMGFLGWAILKKEWVLAPLPSLEPGSDPWSVRSTELIAAAILGMGAFTLMGGNLFTLLNLAVWLLAIGMLVRAFWLKPPTVGLSSMDAEQEKPKRQFKVTGWGLLVLAVVTLVTFMRVYRLSGVPAEPFSDHAEKILDVYDITQGQTHIFFPRNTGREAIQMYLTVLVAWLFHTGLSFLSLKIGTVICGLLTLPYLYLLGREFANKRVGLLAVLMAGMAYWPNVISRVGLRFPLYPLFVAPVMFYLLRGLRRFNRNDFILAGLFLGLGLHGYSPFRIVPFLVLLCFGLFVLSRSSKGLRWQALVWLGVVVITSLFVFLPLLRYWIENPGTFSFRAFSRLGGEGQALPLPWWQILVSNTWNALRMFNWSDGRIWVNSVPNRPALDIVSAVLFLFGLVLLLVRVLRQRQWQDGFLLLSIPVLMLPSILSLAFPDENPALNRAGGALVPVFIVVALALEGLLTGLAHAFADRRGRLLAWSVTGLLLFGSLNQNFDLVFHQYDLQYRMGSWNSSEMGALIEQFGKDYGSTDNAWVVPYPYWVDTRLPGVWAGIPDRDFAMWQYQLIDSLPITGAKLFIYNLADDKTGAMLVNLYPEGQSSRYISRTPNHDFMVFFVPAQ